MISTRVCRVVLLVPFAVAVLVGGCRGKKGGSDDRTAGGRIPGCTTENGIDLFAAEADQVLGLSWTNVGGWDHAGGYRVRWGTAEGSHPDSIDVACPDAYCEHSLSGLANDVTYHVVVDALDSGGSPTETSCEVAARPHALVFGEDLQVNPDSAESLEFPDLAAQRHGYPVFLAWVEAGAVRVARSDDLGDSWSAPSGVGTPGTQSRPSLAFRDAVLDGDGDVIRPPLLFLAWSEAGNVKLARGTFPDGTDGALELGAPVDLGTGTVPDVTAGPWSVHVAFQSGTEIRAVRSSADTIAFGAPVRVDTDAGTAAAPSIAVDGAQGWVYVGYHGTRGPGDSNAYANVSTNGGLSFRPAEVRIDDDATGQNQLNVSIAVDDRTGVALATWEDRRGGANVYFSRSLDGGVTWSPNVQTGAGLSGDQFTPRAAVDPGRNVYVVFIDSTNGRRPMFTRFNPNGSFDPPLPVSTQAGTGGAAANDPAVALDAYGTIYVTWTENRGSPDQDVFFARAE